MKCLKNSLDQKMLLDSLKSPLVHFACGVIKEKLNVSEQQAGIEDTVLTLSLTSEKKNIQTTQSSKNVSATVECPLTDKKKIWIDKLSTSQLNSLTTSLSKTLDLVSTSKEKDLTPFWTSQSKELSKKLWLPTKIDCVDSVLNSSNESSQNTQMGRSWFSIKKKHPLKKNSLMTSFQSSQFSLPDSMDSDPIPLKNKLKKPLKTLKVRLFPTDNEKIKLNSMMDQFRWYYNATVTIVYNHYGHENIKDNKKYSEYTIRDKVIKKYSYEQEIFNNCIFQEFKYDEDRNEMPIPPWWAEEKINNRIPRGAISKFVSSLNSGLSNYRNKNIKNFNMKYRTKKNPTDYIHFEDSGYPALIKQIKSNYWYTTNDRKRNNISFNDIVKSSKTKGLEIIYEKHTGKYFLHYPVEIDWFPEDDKRNDSQVKFVNKGDRIISLDPGIRKFLVGYDPTGESIFIGEGASLELTKLLYEVDVIENPKKKYLVWKKIKNLVEELHWKTISFLLENYDVIILPDFRVSQMIKKKKLSRMTKRLMCMFSFFSFKEKLKEKSRRYEKKVIIVDESYTSCTCGVCGHINNTKGNEVFKCSSCNLVLDRDVQGSRNIFIKNITLR